MMIHAAHGMLSLAGMGLIANVVGLIAFALAAVGLYRARAPRVLTLWLVVAVVGAAVVICGTTVVIASE
jgi:hypothetical protein